MNQDGASKGESAQQGGWQGAFTHPDLLLLLLLGLLDALLLLDLEESLLRLLVLLRDDLSSALPLADGALGELGDALDGAGGLGGEVLGVGL